MVGEEQYSSRLFSVLFLLLDRYSRKHGSSCWHVVFCSAWDLAQKLLSVSDEKIVYQLQSQLADCRIVPVFAAESSPAHIRGKVLYKVI